MQIAGAILCGLFVVWVVWTSLAAFMGRAAKLGMDLNLRGSGTPPPVSMSSAERQKRRDDGLDMQRRQASSAVKAWPIAVICLVAGVALLLVSALK